MVNPDWRSWLEAAYFASGILVAIVAAFGLRQLIIAKHLLVATRAQVELASEALKVAKNDLSTRVRREAVVLAAERCHHFAAELLPSVNPRLDQIRAAGIGIHNWTYETRASTAHLSWNSRKRRSGLRL